MAESAVSFLLEKVEQILTYYATLVAGAESELDQLKNELALLKCFLKDAAKMQKKDNTFRELERQIRRVVYDAEDTIDACVTAATAATVTKKSRNPFRRARKAVDIPSKINLAEKVKSLREDGVKKHIELVKTMIANGSGIRAEQPSARVEKVQFIREDNVVGFKDEEDTLINYLMDQSLDQLDVISIIGMPGLGKTTLAWKIFRNRELGYQFPYRIWVNVSQQFTVRDVLINILKEFGSPNDISSVSDFELAKRVRSHLETSKFLLVMDDVWTVEAWNQIKPILPMNNSMGKVLITSRHKSVGAHANVTRKPHMLRFLNKEESEELLQLEVCGKGPWHPQLESMGKHIAKQCDGLPLAIVVVGGILVGLKTEIQAMNEIVNAWEDVSKNVSSYVRNSKDNNCSISDIVALSYNNLPDDLRECFLYLAVFPEDHEIPVWTLTRLWIAEGFVQDQGQGLEKAAEDNLKDLINRNLVMVGESSPNGQVKTCRVHDVIREFCISKVAPAEQDMLQEIKMSAKQGVFVRRVSEVQTYRRICVHSHLPDFLEQILGTKGGSVRSFLCFCKRPVVLDGAYISTIPDSFELLRVLDSKSFKFDQFPSKVTKLIHLKYITLAWDALDVLPQDISKLWNLQTLVVETQCPTIQMEADISKMIQLRHLKTKAAIILAAKAEGTGGENLQTLSRLSPEHCTQEVFEKARNLKRLGVRGHLDTLSNATSLEKLDNLESLKLMNYLKHYVPSERPMRSLPATKHFPRNIKRLTLSATHLGWEHMSILGKIANLQVLKLKEYAFTGHKWSVDGGFDALQFLLIATTDLMVWDAPDNQFRKLTCLVLKNCVNLDKIPLGLAKSLQILEIERDIPKSAVESAKKIKEERTKMQEQGNLGWDEFKLTIGPGCE